MITTKQWWPDGAMGYANTRWAVRSFRERNPYVVALIGITLGTLVMLSVLARDQLPIIGGGTHYSVDFTEAGGLRTGDDVSVAGVTVGRVTAIALEGSHVRVTVLVRDTWLGNQSTAAIKIKTLLGSKYLAISPRGTAPLDPDTPIPTQRTTSPFDVQQAFNGLSHTIDRLDTNQLAQSFDVLAETFADTPGNVRGALNGLSALSRTISSRDTQLQQLLANTNQLSGTLADRDAQIQTLITDGSTLLNMVQQRESAISALLSGTQALASQLSGLVNDNQQQLGPVLTELNQLTNMLRDNQNSLANAVSLLAPFTRLFDNVAGNGRWADGYICGLLPPAIGPINPGGCSPS